MASGLKCIPGKSLLKFVMALVTEVVQLCVPARAFNPFDLVANVAGLTAGGVQKIP